MRRCCSPPWWPRPPGCRRGCVARWRVAWRPKRWQVAENACGVPWPRAGAMDNFAALSGGILRNIVATKSSAETPPSAKPPAKPQARSSLFVGSTEKAFQVLEAFNGPQRNAATRLHAGKARLPAAHPGFTAVRPELEGLASVLPLFALQRLDREGVPVFVGHQPQSR